MLSDNVISLISKIEDSKVRSAMILVVEYVASLEERVRKSEASLSAVSESVTIISKGGKPVEQRNSNGFSIG